MTTAANNALRKFYISSYFQTNNKSEMAMKWLLKQNTLKKDLNAFTTSKLNKEQRRKMRVISKTTEFMKRKRKMKEEKAKAELKKKKLINKMNAMKLGNTANKLANKLKKL